MTRASDVRGGGLGGPLGLSLLLHAGLVALIIALRPPPPPALPPIYRVNIVAAPPGPRAAGVVTQAPQLRPEEPAPVPKRAEQIPRAMPLPVKKPAAKQVAPATPTPPVATPKPKPGQTVPEARGGRRGGQGRDVARVRTGGVEFPFPGYLDNIVRQIALRFHPPRNALIRAEVMFLIRRDGSVADIHFVTRSGNFQFDLEAQGAIDQAGQVKAFGPLPSGFTDDVLPVIFSFDPRVLK